MTQKDENCEVRAAGSELRKEELRRGRIGKRRPHGRAGGAMETVPRRGLGARPGLHLSFCCFCVRGEASSAGNGQEAGMSVYHGRKAAVCSMRKQPPGNKLDCIETGPLVE
jgi:hypothetical protein